MKDLNLWMAVGQGIAIVFLAVWGFHERYNKEKITREKTAAEDINKIIAVKDELAKSLEHDRNEWKMRAETEHREFKEYQKTVHAQKEEAQAIILRQTADIADLRAKTDITPLLTAFQDVTKILSRMNSALEILLKEHEMKAKSKET